MSVCEHGTEYLTDGGVCLHCLEGEEMERDRQASSAASVALEVQEADVRFRAERLASSMRSVAARLERLAQQLDNDPTGALLNSLGELQAEGSFIDAGAGGYMAAQSALKLMQGEVSG